MRFTLIDRILDLKAGEEITAVKNLSLAEDYLADHFPLFPVLPGVFMLEAMTQASAWLIRYTENFAHSIVVLSEARNVKYADFVEPGSTLTVKAKLLKEDQRTTTMKAEGTVDGHSHVSARLILERYNLAETNADDESSDRAAIQDLRALFA
ncbi:MAG: beta-hydroxyacyl-ACP dehydratase, partial [Planctomycetales bacterium]|nr:beta-hydroxyacyl-ACP dehydratase [Planctomycetales bacterium]NIM09516.1 beta-hydroxyacyl-ACP dehydratase [Planctomycetales bacterium]NIN09004.1 beta-hydroxyacyl-ACP dehydratase [Planctomycetales bacterium]NIN78119.1 beta-hydroxyacyl-ACP dehydratase [Planctomycetales bacterium]NIO35299.1 beta-hydroxyacyl-ACP dehydratase [Planctomycetales bacterium]